MQNDVILSCDKLELLTIALELLMESNNITVKGYGIPVAGIYSADSISEAKSLIKEVETLISNKGTDIHTIGNDWVNNGFFGSTKTIKYLLSK